MTPKIDRSRHRGTRKRCRQCTSMETTTYQNTARTMILPRQHMWLSIAVLAIASMSGQCRANAADCPRQGTLGTSRVMEVSAATYPRVGLKSFPHTLPLADHEVVLTFDDGPLAATTPKILAALAAECVRATFFVIGRSAAEFPNLIKQMAEAGHSVGHHSWSHPLMTRRSFQRSREDIDRGIAAVEQALNNVAATTPSTPFFRFPYFSSTPQTLELLQSRAIVVFGTDLWASDWDRLTPSQELQIVTERLRRAGKGIILFHDSKARTAAMLPEFLRYLRRNGYRVVHVVAAKTVPQHAQTTP